MNYETFQHLEQHIRAQQAKIQKELLSFYQTTRSDPTQAGAGQPESIKIRLTCGIAEIAALDAFLDTIRRQVFNSPRDPNKISTPTSPE